MQIYSKKNAKHRRNKCKKNFPIRHPVLRRGKSKESCLFDGDDLETTSHFNLFYDQELNGVISLFKNTTDLFLEKIQYQIRDMAVLENYRRKHWVKH